MFVYNLAFKLFNYNFYNYIFRLISIEKMDSDEDYFLGEFGDNNPEVLQRTAYGGCFLSLHFSFRARDASRRLKWGDVQQHLATNFLFGKPKEAQTHAMEMANNEHSIYPVAQDTQSERCPVKLYNESMKRPPNEMKTPESPSWPLTTKENQTVQYGIQDVRWEKMKSANFSRKQPKMQVWKEISPTIVLGRRVLLG